VKLKIGVIGPLPDLKKTLCKRTETATVKYSSLPKIESRVFLSMKHDRFIKDAVEYSMRKLVLSAAVFLLNFCSMYATAASEHLGTAIFFFSAPASVSTHINKKEIKSFTEPKRKKKNQPAVKLRGAV